MTVSEAVTETTGTSEQRAQLLGLQKEEPYATPHPTPMIEDFEEVEGSYYDADSTPTAAHSVPQQRLRPQSQPVARTAHSAPPGRQREVANEESLAPYLMALENMVKGQLRKRKKKKSQNRAVDSALLTMAELQTSIPRDSGVLSRQHLKLISKMMTRIEELSYKAGYLEGCIDAANTESSANILEEIYPAKAQSMEFIGAVETPEYQEGDKTSAVAEQKSGNSSAHDEHQQKDERENETELDDESSTSEGGTETRDAGPGQEAQTGSAKKGLVDNSRMSKKKRKRMMTPQS